MHLSKNIEKLGQIDKLATYNYPWEITNQAENIIREMIPMLGDEFVVTSEIAIHKNSIIENNVTIKSPAIIGKNCFLASGSYLRGGVFLDSDVHIGPSVEIKSSFIFSNTSIAHLNYVGNSIIGSRVNIEAGAVVANHFNERTEKNIKVVFDGEIVSTNSEKFGSMIGDDARIGANAVLSPGTILKPGIIVARLELVDQIKK